MTANEVYDQVARDVLLVRKGAKYAQIRPEIEAKLASQVVPDPDAWMLKYLDALMPSQHRF